MRGSETAHSTQAIHRNPLLSPSIVSLMADGDHFRLPVLSFVCSNVSFCLCGDADAGTVARQRLTSQLSDNWELSCQNCSALNEKTNTFFTFVTTLNDYNLEITCVFAIDHKST